MNDIERIRFVTRRFNELKGLQPATTGAILLAGSVLLRFLFASSTYAIEPAYFLNAAVCSGAISWSVFDPRYRATFGRSESSIGEASVVLANLALMVGITIDMLAQRYVQWPSAAAVALGLGSLVVVVRDWRWRIHHVIPLVAAIVAALMTAAVPAGAPAFKWEGDSLRGSVFLLAYALIGVAMIAAGLLDHALLSRTLRPADVAHANSPSRSRRVHSGRAESRVAAVVSGCAVVTLFFPPGEMVVALPFALSMVWLGCAVLFTWKARRRQESLPPANPPPLDDSRDFVVPLIVLAIAGAVDVALSSAGPVLCTAAFGVWSLSIAVRSWATHRHYLLGAFTAAGLLVVMPRLVPPQALTLCVLATAAALAIERYADAEIEATHVDAV